VENIKNRINFWRQIYENKKKNQYIERWISKTILKFLYEIRDDLKNGVENMSFKSNIYSQKTPNNHKNYSID
jgi:hypothetical protein